MKKLLGVLLVALLAFACNSDTKLFKRAQLAASKGDFSKDIQLYSRVIKQSPNAATAYLNRGVLWENQPAKTAEEKQKNRAFAEEDYKKAIALDNTFAQAYNNLAALYIEMGRYHQAVSNLDEALYYSPNYFTAQRFPRRRTTAQ